LMKALSAELNVPPLALLLVISCSGEGELRGVAVGNILGFCATAVPLRPMQLIPIMPRTNRVFMENLCFIGFDSIRGVETKVWHT
jgi:hypothetical protein